MPTKTFKVGEMLNKRTPNSKTWINFDGSYTTEIHSGIIHYDDENGNLHNINTDLFDEADLDIVDYPVAREGTQRFKQSQKETIGAKKKDILNRDNWNFQGLRVPFDCHIPRVFNRGYTIGKGVDKLTFKPIKSSPSKGYLDSQDRSIINYQDVWNDTDVQLKVLDNGIKESIFLKSDRAPTSFSFEVVGNIDTLTELKLAPAWLVDANGTKRDVAQTTRTENGKTYIDLIADVTSLVYPIEVDPTVTFSSSNTTVKKVGVSSSNVTYNNTSDYPLITDSGEDYEILSSFDLSSIIGSSVSQATMLWEFYNTDGNSFHTTYIGAYQVLSDWNTSTTHQTLPTIDTELLDSFTLYDDNSFDCDWDITSVVKKWVEQGEVNYGTYLKRTSGNNSYKINLTNPRLTVTYNEPPTAPTVTNPNGGETWNSLHNIQWLASTDNDSTDLQYQIQLSVDNGVTWKDIVALTTANVTNYDYDFINEPETSTALVRIRAFDGASYGDWDISDGVFTIQHNTAPTVPTNLSPNGEVYDKATAIRFAWQHNDSDTDPQAQFDLRWRLQGTATWNIVTQATTNNYYDMPENTLPEGSIEWQVRTYDQSGLSSPYSNALVFKTSNKPSSPTITSPVEGEVISVSNPTLQWSSVGQTDYHVKVLNASSTLLWEIIKTSTNKAQTVQYDLLNNTDYKIQVAIKNSDGLWSDFATVNVSVSYTPPSEANIRLYSDAYRGSITFMIDNPTPVDTEPTVTHNNIFRRIEGGEWERIATGIISSFTDYTTISNQAYEYYVRSWGDNGTFVDSPIYRALIEIKHAQLSLITNFDKWVELKLNPKRNETQKAQRQMIHFAGRKYPVAEFGEQSEFDLGLSFLIFDIDELNVLRDLVNRRETLLYRDNRGRKAYVTIDSLNVTDEQPRHYSVSIQPTVVSFTEVV